MGISDLHLLASLDLKGMVLESNSSSGGPLWCKVLKAQAMRRRRRRRNRSRRMVVKRNNGGVVQRLRTRSLRIRGSAVLSEGLPRSAAAMRPMNEVEKKVRILKKLIPNYGSNSMGLDGLFRETAEYIESLQMQVKLMQVMVKALSAGSDDY